MLFTNNLIFYFSIKNIGTIEKKKKKNSFFLKSIQLKKKYCTGENIPPPPYTNIWLNDQ
jgi:hypothetical protein